MMSRVERNAAATRCMRPASPLPFVAWLVLLALQLISPDRAWRWFLLALSVLLVVGYLWARVLRDQVTGRRQTMGTWVVAGDHLRERFTLHNDGPLPVLWARVVDRSDVPGYRADRVETIDIRAQRTWVGTGVCQRRGIFRIGPWDLEMSDPLGLFDVTHHYPDTRTIMVYPRAAHLPDLALPRGRAPGQASSLELAAVETIRVGGVREYLPGDSLRRVHWKATARHNRLMVREFDREPSGDLWLILDLDAAVQAGSGDEATQEYAVILAASLAAQALRGGERRGVGLAASGKTPVAIPPTTGEAQLWRILEALATVEPGAGPSLCVLLRQISPSLGNGCTVVLITPSQEPDWVGQLLPLVARGSAPTALLIDAPTFEPATGTPERLLALRGILAEQRITSHTIARGFPFAPVDRIRREREVLRTLSGTGRVLRVRVEEEV